MLLDIFRIRRTELGSQPSNNWASTIVEFEEQVNKLWKEVILPILEEGLGSEESLEEEE